MADTPEVAALKFFAAAEAVGKIQKKSVAESALLVKKAVLAFAPKRLSGVGKRGAKLGAGFEAPKVLPGSSHGYTTVVQARGPWQLIERDTAPHVIEGNPMGVTHFPGGGDGFEFRRGIPIPHPGTKGQRPFEKGVAASLPVVPRIVAANTFGALRVVF